MRPLKRIGTNKHRSARKFKKNVSKTKHANVTPSPMRGGFRM